MRSPRPVISRDRPPLGGAVAADLAAAVPTDSARAPRKLGAAKPRMPVVAQVGVAAWGQQADVGGV